MSFADFLSYTWGAIVFLTMISILVAAHEYGHYFFARLFGMGVEEFAIGMGKKLNIWRKTTHDIPVAADYVHDTSAVSQGSVLEGGSVVRSDSQVIQTTTGKVLRETTEFTLRMLPIGGFVRIKGMAPQEDGTETTVPGGFYSKPPWQRLVVLFAGPLASVASGVIVLALLYMFHGQEKPVNRPIFGAIGKGGVAQKADLADGDRILKIDGKSIDTFGQMVQIVSNSPGKKLEFTILKKGATKPVVATLTPEAKEGVRMDENLEIVENNVVLGRIGVSPQFDTVKLGPAAAFKEACSAPADAVKGLARIVVKPARLQEEAGGAITMARATYAATMAGPPYVIWLACMLSISVGIFNLLPFPPLDGGQMLIAFAELLRRGRRLSLQVQNALMSAGLAVVLLLTVTVLVIDIRRVAKPSPSSKSVGTTPDKEPAKSPGK